MTLQWLIGPLVGGVIGYITNSIAIKMLFRPLKPVYLCGKKLPFTPGMIPKEQARIAKTVGEVVGKELINEETLKAHLLSQDMVVKLEKVVDDWLRNYKQSTQTVEEALHTLLGDATLRVFAETLEEGISHAAYQKVVSMQLGEPLAKQAVQAIAGSLGPMAMMLGGTMLQTAEVKLEAIIQTMIEERGEEVITTALAKEKETLFATPVGELIEKLEHDMPKIKYVLVNQYVNVIENQLTKMIQTIDIPNIVEEKIKNYDVLEMESMILSIVKKELNAIVYLGALLGAIMGVVMNLF